MQFSGSSLSIGLCVSVISSLLVLAIPDLAPAQTTSEKQQVPFLTVRNRTNSDDPTELYGDERGVLKSGLCRVKEIDLNVLSPIAESAPSFIREEFVRVNQVTELNTSAVFEEVRKTSSGRVPVLYVHGYYMSFEKGCRRAALFQKNANVSDRFMWFSWPSDGAITNYTHDEADLFWSIPDIAEAIVQMDEEFGAVHIAGHSLGARGVVLALYAAAIRNPEIRIGEVVLLAPDMDFGIFQRILPRILPIVDKITVYVTSGDRPLALSAQLHGYARLGEADNDVSQLDGVDFIDLSDLASGSPTGHLYHIYNNAVGWDLDQLLNDGKRVDERENLERVSPNRWRLTQTD